MRIKRIFVALMLAFFLLSLSSYGQGKNQVAENMAVKLQQKVLLSKDQTDKVKDILINYLKDSSQSSLEIAQKSIESVLDKRQKAKYDIIKNNWWNSVQKETANIQN